MYFKPLTGRDHTHFENISSPQVSLATVIPCTKLQLKNMTNRMGYNKGS